MMKIQVNHIMSWDVNVSMFRLLIVLNFVIFTYRVGVYLLLIDKYSSVTYSDNVCLLSSDLSKKVTL